LFFEYSAQGFQNEQISKRLDLPRQIVSKWRKCFYNERLKGLRDRKRRGHKIFGLISYTDEKFFSAGIEGRFNSESYISFLKDVFVKNKQHIILIQDGARYHVSKQTNELFQDNK